jgi:hypothetical protein
MTSPHLHIPSTLQAPLGVLPFTPSLFLQSLQRILNQPNMPSKGSLYNPVVSTKSLGSSPIMLNFNSLTQSLRQIRLRLAMLDSSSPKYPPFSERKIGNKGNIGSRIYLFHPSSPQLLHGYVLNRFGDKLLQMLSL